MTASNVNRRELMEEHMQKCPENIFSFQLTLDELSDKKRKKEGKGRGDTGREGAR